MIEAVKNNGDKSFPRNPLTDIWSGQCSANYALLDTDRIRLVTITVHVNVSFFILKRYNQSRIYKYGHAPRVR